jgi:hypothetical protein
MLMHVPEENVDCWSQIKEVPLRSWQGVRTWENSCCPRWSWYYIVAWTPYATEQNGIAEREKHMVVELALSVFSVRYYQNWCGCRAAVKLEYMYLTIQDKHRLSGNHLRKCGMVTRWTRVICVCFSRSVMYTSQNGCSRNSTTRACLVEWLAMWRIRTGPCLNKNVHSYVYFKPEWVCTSSVFKMGLNMKYVEDVVAEKTQVMIQRRSRHSRWKSSRWRQRKSFIRTQEDQ